MREIEVKNSYKENLLDINIGNRAGKRYGAIGITLTKEEAKDLMEKLKRKLEEAEQ